MNLIDFNNKYEKKISSVAVGLKYSKCLILSDFATHEENRDKLPISGYRLVLLRDLLKQNGIELSQLRIENFWPFKIPGNDLNSLKTDDFVLAARALEQRSSEMSNLNLIVVMNNETLFLLTGKGKVSAEFRNAFSLGTITTTEAEKKASINVLRGSIYEYLDLSERKIKVMPVLHPRDIIKVPKWAKRSLHDWDKVAKELKQKERIEIKRKHIINPLEWEVNNFVKNIEYVSNEALSVDIETWGGKISCVGFAPNEYLSITIPTVTNKQENAFFPAIKKLCSNILPKIFCNGLYDTYWFDYYNIPVNSYIWDVQYMHHALDPIEKHSLDFLASIYSTANYWKDEAKDADEILKYSKNLDAIWTYNGKDCCVTYEVWKNLKEILKRENVLNTYFNLYYPLLEPSLKMARQGIRIDKKAQNTWRKEIEAKQIDLRKKLEDFAGENLFATETKTKYREPTQEEWDELLPKNTKNSDFDDRGIPKARIINRKKRESLLQTGIKYHMSGKKAGKISYKEKVDKKDFSKSKLFRLFHEILALPKQYKRRKGKNDKTQSLDEGAIRKLIQKYPDKAGEVGNWLLAYRSLGKEHVYLRGGYDKDGRIRAGFTPMTDAGRFKSHKNPRGTGFNLQNLKR
jgi:uracil-DNA glycosylase